MSTQPILTPASMAVFLITQRCLTTIFAPDGPEAPSPVASRALTPEERGALGLTTAGVTLAYLVDDVEVYLDLAGTSAAVWFGNGDFFAAPPLLEDMLAVAFQPDEVTILSVPPLANTETNVREYNLAPRNARRAALLRVTVGRHGAGPADRMFVARVFPHEAVVN